MVCSLYCVMYLMSASYDSNLDDSFRALGWGGGDYTIKDCNRSLWCGMV